MTGLRVSDDELRALLVTQLEIVTQAEFESAQTTAKRLRTSIGKTLVERGRIPQGFLLEQLAQAWGVKFIDLKVSDISPQALRAVDVALSKKHALIPFQHQDRQLRVAMCDPRDRTAIEAVQRKTRLEVKPYLAPGPAIQRAQLLYDSDLRDLLNLAATEGTYELEAGDDLEVPKLLDRLLQYAAVTQASDIHIEPYETGGLVRYRLDGVLREVVHLPLERLPSLTSRVKVLSGMRIDDRRSPQDGRFEANLDGLKFDLRVSSLPTQWGEKMVMRVLPKEFLTFGLEDLGLTADDYQTVLRNVLRPYGMVLVTGPTGTGKSSTLYAMLARLGAERRYVVNISTVEDPIEYSLPRVNQVSVNLGAGMAFSTALRALLRQDPDIIMVGEIRDRDTVEIAVRAALVGRLLFSTLHTNDATGAIPRLIDMGAEPFLLASTLSLVIGQRLVRRICTSCRESFVPDRSVIDAFKLRPDFEKTIQALKSQGALGQADDPLAGIRLFRGKGCVQCQGSGFRGRLGVFELFEIDDEVRAMIMQRTDAISIRAAATARGMKTLFQDGLAKVFLGQTSLEEVVRVAL